MKKYLSLILMIGLAISLLPAQKVLVIGNSGYGERNIPQILNDTAHVDTTLAQNGWEVTKHTDLDADGMKRAILNFTRKLKKDEMALFYYSGAAIQLEGKNYLVPLGKFPNDKVFKLEAAELNWVISQFAKADLKLIFIDAARQPSNVSFKVAKQGLAEISKFTENTLVMYGTPLNTLSTDNSVPNSRFAKTLVQQLLEPSLELNNLADAIAKQMVILDGGKTPPIPWSASSIKEEYLINPEGENMPRYILRGVYLQKIIDGGGSYSF